ncbi:MAG: hypothetical protein QM698_02225 [Micropepsaceae bacterium]
MKKLGAAIAVMAFGGIVAACGGSGDFKAKIQAQCEKTDKTTDCACAADILDKELDSKTKDVMLTVLKAMEADDANQEEALKAAGISEEDAAKMMIAAMPVMQKAQETCKKK